MSTQSETADLMMKEGIQITERAIRLSALGAVNLAALLVALSKNNYRLQGKTSLKRLIKEGRELKVFPLKTRDLEQFKLYSKDYGVLFSPIVDKSVQGQPSSCDILIRAEDISKVNYILGKMGYSDRIVYGDEEANIKKAQILAQQESGSKEQGIGKGKVKEKDDDSEKSVRKRIVAFRKQVQQKNKSVSTISPKRVRNNKRAR